MPTRSYDASIVHTGENDVTINFANERFVYGDLHQVFGDGDKVTVEFKSRRKPRSLPQNAYMHLCLQMIADETGNSLEAVKSTLKSMYAKKPLLDKEGEAIYDKTTGEQAMYVQDTRDMSSIEAAEFTEKVRMFALDFVGLILPEPQEQIDIKFNK